MSNLIRSIKKHKRHVPMPGGPGAMLIAVHTDLPFAFRKALLIGQRMTEVLTRSVRKISLGAMGMAYLTTPSLFFRKNSHFRSSTGSPSRDK